MPQVHNIWQFSAQWGDFCDFGGKWITRHTESIEAPHFPGPICAITICLFGLVLWAGAYSFIDRGPKRYPKELVWQRFYQTFAWNILVRFASKPSFYWVVSSNCSETCLVPFVQFSGLGFFFSPFNWGLGWCLWGFRHGFQALLFTQQIRGPAIFTRAWPPMELSRASKQGTLNGKCCHMCWHA